MDVFFLAPEPCLADETPESYFCSLFSLDSPLSSLAAVRFASRSFISVRPRMPAFYQSDKILSAYWKLGLWMAVMVLLHASNTTSLENP